MPVESRPLLARLWSALRGFPNRHPWLFFASGSLIEPLRNAALGEGVSFAQRAAALVPLAVNVTGIIVGAILSVGLIRAALLWVSFTGASFVIGIVLIVLPLTYLLRRSRPTRVVVRVSLVAMLLLLTVRVAGEAFAFHYVTGLSWPLAVVVAAADWSLALGLRLIDRAHRDAHPGRRVVARIDLRRPSGELVYSSADAGAPEVFIVGAPHPLPGLDAAVNGLKPGESRTVRLTPSEAFGVHDQARVLTLPLPLDQHVVTGSGVDFTGLDRGVVISVDDRAVIIDFNDPLVGETLDATVTVDAVERL